ncbi:MAG: hypothetical protein ACFNXV_07780, partial [Pauljensenia sp.]
QPGYGAQPGASGYSATNQWGWAAKPGIIPLRPLGLADLLSGSFQALRTNPTVLFGFTFAVMSIVSLISAVTTYLPFLGLQSTTGFSDPQAATSRSGAEALQLLTMLGGSGVRMLATFVGTTILVGVLAAAVSQLMIGNKLTVGQAWSMTMPRLGSLLGTLFLTGLIVTAPILLWLIATIGIIYSLSASDSLAPALGGMALLFLPVFALIVFLNIKLQFAPICAVLEEAGPVTSLKRSWALTDGAFWSTLGRMVLISMVTGAIGGLIGLVIGAITVVLAFTTTGGGVGSSPLVLAISSALTILAAGMATPITSTYETLIYADLRIRKENFASVLAQASNRQ